MASEYGKIVTWGASSVSRRIQLHEPYFSKGPVYVIFVRYNARRQHSRYSDSLRARRSGDRVPVEARFSTPVQTGPVTHPASCTMGTESFPGVKRQGCGVDHLPPTSARLRKQITSLWCVLKKNKVFLFSPATFQNQQVRVASVAPIAVAVTTGCRKSHTKFSANRPRSSED